MILGIFLSPGDSLTKQKQSGQLDRLIKYYLSTYVKHFNYIYLFSYGDYNQYFNLPNKVILIPKPKYIPNYLYQLILPLIYQTIIHKIDIFRVFQAPGGLPAVISKIIFKKPYIVSNNYDYIRFAQVENKFILAFVLRLIVPLILKHADKIITPKVIPNGVDPQLFKPSKRLQKKYLVLSIGRLVNQKNYKLLLKVISLSKFKSKIKLIIIGKGLLKTELVILARKLKVNLQIIPNLNHAQLVSWYQKANVFALTSKIEGQPKVLLEAMSCACACLTTAFSGNIIKDEVTGLIGVGQNQLSKKLDQLLSDSLLREKLGLKARQLIINQYNLKKLLIKEVKLIKLCVKS